MRDVEQNVVPFASLACRRDVFRQWWPCLLILACAGCVMSFGLTERTHGRVMENISVGSSQESWLRFHGHAAGGFEREGLKGYTLPSFNGLPRVVKPPMLVWVHGLAVLGDTPETLDFHGYLTRVRWTAVSMALLMLFATYWAGLSLGDRWLAVLATVMAGSTWFFVKMGQTAAYDIHLAAWGTLAIAAALSALRIIEPCAQVVEASAPRQTWRRAYVPGVASTSGSRAQEDASSVVKRGRAGVWLRWLLVVFAVVMAYMTKGPLALLIVAGPVLVMLAVWGDRCLLVRGTLGVLLASLASLMVFGAWFLYAQDQVPDLSGVLQKEYVAERATPSPWYYYIGLLGLLLPWSPYLVGGLLHPWLNARGVDRRLRLLPWAWFVLILLAFSLAGAKQQRYILPIVPAASLMMAWVARDLAWRCAQGRPDAGAWLLQRPVWMGLIVASAGLPVLLCTQEWWVSQSWLPGLVTQPIGVAVAVAWGTAMMACAVCSALLFERKRGQWAVVVAGMWCGVFIGGYYHWYAQHERATELAWSGAARVAEVVGNAALVAVLPEPATQETIEDQEEMIALLRRRITTVDPQDVAQRVATGERVFVLTEPTEQADALMQVTGLVALEDIVVDHVTTRRLWGLTQ